MSRRAWNTYLGVAAAAVAGYFLIPDDTWTQTIYAELVGLLATGMIVVGVVKPGRCHYHHHRPGAAVVGVPDPPGGRRQLPALGRPCGQHCLPGGRHPGAGHGHSAVGRRRQPHPGVSPAGWGDAAVLGWGWDLGRISYVGLEPSPAWSAQLRAVDQLARYGGEEFIAVLPRATAELATGVLERLWAVTPAGQTFSAGVATWDGNETSEELIGRADQALYQAKDAGRDRIVVAAEEAQTASQPGPRRLMQDAAT
jgi:hypothetical protein